MLSPHYERLSALDYSFVAAEGSCTPMHVAMLQVFRTGPLRTPAGGVDVKRIRAAYRGVLHRMPRYRQKLMEIPLEGRSVWVDDEDFRLDDHVRHLALPRPGGEAELLQLVSQLIADPLDRARPLWEAWLIEGLEHDRFAILTKTHHCMVDGVSGVDIAQRMLSASPDTLPPPPEPWTPRRAPTPAELLRSEAFDRATLPLRVLGALLRLESPEELGRRYRALQDFVDVSTSPCSPTPLNGALGPRRRFAWTTLSLAEVRAIREKLGCTVNDVVLATATGAFRNHLQAAGVDLDGIVFRASAPVSLRAEGNDSPAGNRVATWFVRLPVEEPDRVAQLDAVRRETERLKVSDLAEGMDIAMSTTALVPAPLLGAVSGLAATAVNTIVSNIAGPRNALYLCGAPLRAMIPSVPLLQNVGLGNALLSYDGRIAWGCTADPELVPDLDDFVARIVDSFAALRSAAGVGPDREKMASGIDR